MTKKISNVRELVPKFLEYYRKNLAWGVLHVMFDDGNWDSAEFCLAEARAGGKPEDIEVAELAAKLSRTQRIKLARLVHEEYYQR